MTPVGELLVFGFIPCVGSVEPPLTPRCSGIDPVISHHAECWNYVFDKVLVLVVAPYNNKIGLKAVQLLTHLAKAVEERLTMSTCRRYSFVLTPFLPHPFRPVRGIPTRLWQMGV